MKLAEKILLELDDSKKQINHDKANEIQNRNIENTKRLNKAKEKLSDAKKNKKVEDVKKYSETIKRLQNQIKIDQKRIKNVLSGKPEDDGIKNAMD